MFLKFKFNKTHWSIMILDPLFIWGGGSLIIFTMHMNDTGLWFAFNSAWESLASILYQLLKISWEILPFSMLHNSLNAIENIHNVISKPALLVDHAVFLPQLLRYFWKLLLFPESVSGFTQDVFVFIFFCFTALLRYNWYTKRCTDLMCTICWVWTYA